MWQVRFRNLGIGLSSVLMAIAFYLHNPYIHFNQDDGSSFESWQHALPASVRESMLWSADHEEGTLFDWEYDQNPDNNGGGVFNTGGKDEVFVEAATVNPLTGKYCAQATISKAILSRNGNKAVRLMRWTDKPWDQGGALFPKSAYYGVWMRLDRKYSTQNETRGDGGWWNVFQFKSLDANGTNQPIWILNIGDDPQTGIMHFYLYSDQNQPTSFSQIDPKPIPVGRWFHVEALFEQSDSNTANGAIKVWQDGQRILSAKRVKTVLAKRTFWGIGNYTDHISGGPFPGMATIYFDDATISTKPTHPYVDKLLRLQR